MRHLGQQLAERGHFLGRLVAAGHGQMAVVDPQQPHAFVNSGAGILRQIDIHLSPRFVTEWLE